MVEGRAAVSSWSFFTPSSDREEYWKEGEADGDNYHIDEKVKYPAAELRGI
jgi:hypothetical protein